jgi:uncharacterized RDD family membrane protein YckC
MDPINILDNDFNSRQEKQRHVIYGGFWIRTGALFIDALITSVVVIPLTIYNVGNLKSIPLLVIMSLISILYKPAFEFLYGATPGKMALNLRVVNSDFGKADFTAIFLRNIFGIVSSVLVLVFTIIIFSSSEFESVTGFFEYSTYLGNVKEVKYINGFNFVIGLAEIICLLSDPQKRALHDRIGRTYVIEEPR